MNNSRFLQEAIDLEKLWKKNNLLKGIEDKFSRAITAKDLECQRLHNETGTWDCCDECKEKAKHE